MIVALIVVAVGAYLYFSKSTTTDKPTTATTNTLVSTTTGDSPVSLGDTNSASSFAGSDIAVLLKNIDQIKLNRNWNYFNFGLTGIAFISRHFLELYYSDIYELK